MTTVTGSNCPLLRRRLRIMKIGNCPLRMRRRSKDEPFFVFQNPEPGRDITRVIRSRLHHRHDVEIGAQENGADFGNQLFARTLRLVLRVSPEVTVETTLGSNPMDFLMRKGRVIGLTRFAYTTVEPVSRTDGRLQEDFRRSRGRFPSWHGIPFSNCRLASQIEAAFNLDSHDTIGDQRRELCKGRYAPDTSKGMGSVEFASSRMSNVYLPCGSTSTE